MTDEKLSKLLNKDNLIRGYIYNNDGLAKECLFENSPFNIANFIMMNQDAKEIIITDILDKGVLSTMGCFINQCPDKDLLEKVKEHLIPIQLGKKEPEDIPFATAKEVEGYYQQIENHYGMENDIISSHDER